MLKKYDLKQMLKEIKEDEVILGASTSKVSQDTIQQMMLKRLKKRGEQNEQQH